MVTLRKKNKSKRYTEFFKAGYGSDDSDASAEDKQHSKLHPCSDSDNDSGEESDFKMDAVSESVESEEEEEDLDVDEDASKESDTPVSEPDSDIASIYGDIDGLHDDPMVIDATIPASSSAVAYPSTDELQNQWDDVQSLLEMFILRSVAIVPSGDADDGGSTQSSSALIARKLGDQGRFKCPIEGCTKLFKSVTGLKYHARNFTHSLLKFLNEFRATDGEQINAVLGRITGSCKQEKLETPLVEVLVEGEDKSFTYEFLFDAVVDKEPELPVEKKEDPTKSPAHIRLQSILSDCIRGLLKEEPLRPISTRIDEDLSHFDLGRKQLALTFKQVSGKYECSIPGCGKLFTTQPSIRYHFLNHSHELSPFLESQLFESADSVIRDKHGITDKDALAEVIKAGMENIDDNSVTTDLFLYHWPKIANACASTIKFVIPSPPPVVEFDGATMSSCNRTYRKHLTLAAVASVQFNGPKASNLSGERSNVLYDGYVTSANQIIAIDACQYLTDAPIKVKHGKEDEYEIGARISKDITEAAGRPAYLVNAGGYSFCARWAPDCLPDETQYFAIGSSLCSEPLLWKRTVSGPGTIQVWSCEVSDTPRDDGQVKPMLTICHHNGHVLTMKWLSKGGRIPGSRVGLLAVTFSSGHLGVYAIPELQQSVTGTVAPLFSTKCEDGMFTAISWSELSTSRYLAAGDSRGYITVFNVKDFAKSKVRPIAIHKAHDYQVAGLDWCGLAEYIILSSGFDGRFRLTDIRETEPSIQLCRQLEFPHAVEWSSYLQSAITVGPDFVAKHIMETDYYLSSCVMNHTNSILDISCSRHHEFIASASADGTAKISNIQSGRIRGSPAVMVPVYELGFADDGAVLHFHEKVKKEKLSSRNRDPMSFHDSGTSVSSIDWNPNVHANTWLLTATRCGLVRLECMASKS